MKPADAVTTITIDEAVGKSAKAERQAMPREGRENVVPKAFEDFERMMAEAVRRGHATYDTTLKTHNGRNALRDLREELIDAWQYATQAVMEHQDLLDERNDLRCRVDALEAKAVELLLERNVLEDVVQRLMATVAGQAAKAREDLQSVREWLAVHDLADLC